MVGTLSDPQFGVANFNGAIDPDMMINGDYAVMQGDFSGAVGMFMAIPQQGTTLADIPTLTPWMLGVRDVVSAPTRCSVAGARRERTIHSGGDNPPCWT